MGDSVRQVMRTAQERGDAARAGRRLRAEQPLQRRHPPAGHHRGHAGVRRRRRRRLVAFVAARGHHADIGGITPGSMPPSSTPDRRGRRADRDSPAGHAGRFARPAFARAAGLGAATRRATSTRTSATSRPRSPPAPAARRELKAAMAEHGTRRGAGLYGPRAGQRRGGGAPHLGRLKSGDFRYETDDGWAVAGAHRASTRAARTATVDFTGTSAQLATNFNAPPSIAARRRSMSSAPCSTTTSR